MALVFAEFYGGPWDGERRPYETDVEWVDLPVLAGPYVTTLQHRYYRVTNEMWLYMGVY